MTRGRVWSPATHHHWPDGFKAVARILLLAANRGVGSAGSTAGGRSSRLPVAALPAAVLPHILQQAALPMSAWL
jgi:hypothetical protein